MRVPSTSIMPVSAPRTVPLIMALLLAIWPMPSAAQKMGDRVRVRAGTALRAVPDGQVLGVLSRDYEGRVESAQGTSVRMRLVGFVSADELRIESDQGRALVGGSTGATVRTGASATDATLAELRRGGVVFPGAHVGTFVEITRPVWVDKSRLLKAAPLVASPPQPAPTARGAGAKAPTTQPSTSSTSVPALPRSTPFAADAPPLETTGPSTLRNAPDGDALASIPGGVVITPLARENGWVRVRMEGWLPDKEVTAAGTRAAGTLTAADLRADPDAAKGRIVRWSVEALAFLTADAVRREMTNGEPYLLARGPGRERAILYLTVPDSLVTTARALPPMAAITVTARVRSGRSQPAGVPILDLLEISRR